MMTSSTTIHRTIRGQEIPCLRDRGLRCRICELTDPASPHYSERFARLYQSEATDDRPERAPRHGEVAGIPGEVTERAQRYAAGATTGTATGQTAGPAPQHPAPRHTSVPLAGDVVEAAAKRLGADRFARWVAKKVGAADCGCAGRRDALNRLDQKLRRKLGLPAPE